MISVVAYASLREEQKIIEKGCRREVSQRTDEQLELTKLQTPVDVEKQCTAEKPTDVVYFQVQNQEDIDHLKSLRKSQQEALLMLLASATLSPMQYLKPGIAPDLLLLRPFEQEAFDLVNHELFDAFMEKYQRQDLENSFVVHTREGKRRIPYSQILYFEARNKKINLRVNVEEYDFYDSIEGLIAKVPEIFLRCHRSYLINSKRIKEVRSSENLIELDGGVLIPMSRTYKQELKRVLK